MNPTFGRWKHERAPDLWPEIQRRLELGAEVGTATTAPRRLTPARVTGLVVATAVVGLGVWAIVQMSNLTSRHISPGREGARAIVRIDVGGPPQQIAVGEGAAWVHVGAGDGTEGLWRIDTRTLQAVRVPGLVGVEWLAAGPEGVWVGVCPEGSINLCPGGKIVRIDPISLRIIAEISTPQPFQMAGGAGYVWAQVAEDGGGMTLLKIDPRTNRVVDRFECCDGLLAVGEGAVWAATDNILTKIDPAKGESIGREGLNDPEGTRRVNACRFAVGEGSVWVSSCDGDSDVLLQVDPNTLEVTGQILFSGLPRLPLQTVGEGWVWVVEQQLTGNGRELNLMRINPRSLDLEREIDLGSDEPPEFAFFGPGPPPLFLDAGEGAVWVSDSAHGEVIRFDPR